MRQVDLTGQTFGRLVVIGHAPSSHRHTRWACRCSCGGESTPSTSGLRSGSAKSCGCLKRENLKRPRVQYQNERGIWRGMMRRCGDPKNHAYSRYGGRGIKVCDRWKVFENFIADMGSRPPGMQIDRIDNDRGYEPTNCRWATRSEQVRNSSRFVGGGLDLVSRSLMAEEILGLDRENTKLLGEKLALVERVRELERGLVEFLRALDEWAGPKGGLGHQEAALNRAEKLLRAAVSDTQTPIMSGNTSKAP